MLSKIFTRSQNQNAATGSAYQAYVRRECETAEGADAQAARLSALVDAIPRERHEARGLARRQAEAARGLSSALRLRAEVEQRIPAVIKRDASAADDGLATSEAALAEARRRAHELEGRQAQAQQRLSEATALRASTAATSEADMQVAKAALVAAHVQGDTDAVAHAEKAFEDVCAAQLKARARLEVQDQLIAAQNDLQASLAAEMEEAQRQVEGHATDCAKWRFEQSAIEADRAALDSLLAFAKALRTRRACGGRVGGTVPRAGIAFFRGERAPYWAGDAGSSSFGEHEMSRLVAAVGEPDWTLFETDPEALLAEESEGHEAPQAA